MDGCQGGKGGSGGRRWMDAVQVKEVEEGDGWMPKRKRGWRREMDGCRERRRRNRSRAEKGDLHLRSTFADLHEAKHVRKHIVTINSVK